MGISFENITQIIVAIISLLGIIYSNRKKKIQTKKSIAIKREKVKTPIKYLLLFWISITLTCVNFGIFGLRIFLNNSAFIEIIYPIDEDKVSIHEIVKGRSKNIPNNKMIWIIVYSYASEKYFPNHNHVQIGNNGNWVSNVIIGSTADYGKKFSILSYLIDEGIKNKLEKEFNRLDFSGLDKLPSNILLHHRIIVYRR